MLSYDVIELAEWKCVVFPLTSFFTGSCKVKYLYSVHSINEFFYFGPKMWKAKSKRYLKTIEKHKITANLGNS